MLGWLFGCLATGRRTDCTVCRLFAWAGMARRESVMRKRVQRNRVSFEFSPALVCRREKFSDGCIGRG